MAIDPSILLQGQVPDLGRSVGNAAQLVQMVNNIKEAPTRRKLMEQEVEGNKLALDAGRQQALDAREQVRFKSMIQGAAMLKPYLDKGDAQGALSELRRRKQALDYVGVDSSDTQEAIDMINAGQFDEVKNLTGSMLEGAKSLGMYGSSGGDLRAREIELRERALDQADSQFNTKMELERAQAASQNRMMDIQDKRLNMMYDPGLQGDLAGAKSAAGAEGKKGAERKAQFEDWAAFKNSFASVYPDIGSILQSAPESSLSNVVSKYGAKIVGSNNLNEAQAEIEQLGAILLQQVPFPPGAQSEAEQRARAMTLGRLEDPNISPAKKLEMINRFLNINEQKFQALSGNKSDAAQPAASATAGGMKTIEVDF